MPQSFAAKRRKKHKMYFGTLFSSRLLRTLVVILLLWPFVAWAAAKFLIVEAPIEHADAIVLLSGSSS
jgi:hypothetical protein